MKALIFGATGQTGSYLCEKLISEGHEVFGVIRRNSTPENQETRIAHIEEKVTTFYGDITDIGSLYIILDKVKPDLIFNLAAQSHVRISFDNPQLTANINAIGVLNLLEAIRFVCPDAKLLQASSSEQFGSSVDEDMFQRESTPFHPVSVYGASKLFAYNITDIYRKSYGLKIYNSICFNHESPRRGSNFVTNKVVKAAVRIKLGLQKKLELGNMDSFRDWGHAFDYAAAQYLIIQQPEPGDYVVATGVTNSVRDMVAYVFDKLCLKWQDYVECIDKHKRPNELDYLKGDSSKIRALGWKPEYNFYTLLDEMVSHWMNVYTIPTHCGPNVINVSSKCGPDLYLPVLKSQKPENY